MKCRILDVEQARAALQALFSDVKQDDSVLYELDMDDKKLYRADQLGVNVLRKDLESEWSIFLQVWE